MRGRLTRPRGLSGWIQSAGIILLAVVTLLLCVLAVTRTDEPPDTSATDDAFQSSPAPTPPATTPPTAASTPTAEAAGSPPRVKDQRRADFTAGDELPDSSRIYDSSTSQGMAIRDDVLTHGAPDGAEAASYLETELASDVQKLGARVRFSPGASGSIALVAWQSSVVSAGRAGEVLPPTGMRFTATPSSWKLTAGPERDVIDEEPFTSSAAPSTFEVTRQGAELWVTDPTGRITHVNDPRLAQYAGPWACWELFETSADQVPAAFEAVWAG